jgi:hypothetical protein
MGSGVTLGLGERISPKPGDQDEEIRDEVCSRDYLWYGAKSVTPADRSRSSSMKKFPVHSRLGRQDHVCRVGHDLGSPAAPDRLGAAQQVLHRCGRDDGARP